MSSTVESAGRLTNTKRQQGEAAGTDLLNLLCSISANGKSERAEVQRLRGWLFTHAGADLPSITYLTGIVVRVLEEGVLNESEETELCLAIERMVPITERGVVQATLEEADDAGQGATGSRPSGEWRNDPMTEAQGQYLKVLGGPISAGATRGEAAELIDQLLKKKPPTSRQLMILRFWDRPAAPEDGLREITAWMDQFYGEDPDRKAAWELFKQETGANGLKGDPSAVTVGVGPEYLARIKARAGGTSRGFQSSVLRAISPAAPGAGVRLLWWILGASVVAGILFLVLRPAPPVPVPARITVPAAAPAVIVQATAPVPVRANPTAAEVSLAELQVFARSMHFTGIVLFAGQTGAMIDGKRVRLGDKLGPAGAYTLVKISAIDRSVTLRDRFGNLVAKAVE